MKKFMIFVQFIMMFLGVATGANAVSFTDTQYLWESLSDTGSFSWTHDTPNDFEVPYDTVNSASLEVYADYVDENNDVIDVQGIFQGSLLNNTWLWSGSFFYPEGTSFDIAEVFTSWNAGDPLVVTLNYQETGTSNGLFLEASVLTLDYTNVSAPGTDPNGTAPVPEPATILLLGAGLLGLVGLSRKQII